VDLSWLTLVRRAQLSEVNQSEIDALLARDPDPDSWVRVLAVAAARPDAAGKEAAWRAAFQERRLPLGTMRMLGRAFWQRSHWQLLAPYAERYLELLPALHSRGMGFAGAVGGAMFPRTAGDEGFIQRATTAADRPEVSPIVRRIVIESCDRLRRRLRARRL
jgi:aminopeptidase N